VVDYMFVRRCDLAKVSDINVIGSEECVQQHKLLICKIDLQESVKKKRMKFVGRHKVWRLRETEIRKDFAERVKYREERREEDEETQRYCDMLEEKDGKGNVFRVAKQMVGLNKDIAASGCVKGVDGRIVVEQEGIMQRWKEYYEQLLNEEFDWNKDNIGSFDVMNREEASVDERLISVYEIRLAIGKAKSGKAAGQSGVAANMLKAAGEAGGRR